MLQVGTYRRYRAVVQNGLLYGDDIEVLTANEEKFLQDLEVKFKQYKRATFLSEKQIDWLDVIESKLQDELGSQYEEFNGE